MGAVDALIADALTAHSVNLLRLAGGFTKAVLLVLTELERDLIAKLTTGPELTTISRQRLLDLLAETRSAIAQGYVDARAELDLKGVAQLEVEQVQQATHLAIGDTLTTGLPNAATMRALVSDLLIQGAPSAEWWSRQAGDTQFRFAQALRTGIAQGETNAQIVARVRGRANQPGVMEVSRRNAEALVRTSVQTVANNGRLAYFQENADVIDGMQQISTLDGRTSATCVAYSGAMWDLDGKPMRGTKLPFNGGPPRHWNCRSALTPVVKELKGFDFSGGQRASVDGPVRADITFAEWLNTKPKAFQDDLLGPGRAEMWRGGKITLQQLLDQKGRPLTLDQLRAKYAG